MQQNNNKSGNMPRPVKNIKNPVKVNNQNKVTSMSKNNAGPAQKHIQQNKQSNQNNKSIHTTQKTPVQTVKPAVPKATGAGNTIKQDINKGNTVRLTRQERAMLLREEAERKRRLRKAKFDYLVSILVIFAVSFLVLSLIFISSFYFSLTSYKKADLNDYTLKLADYEDVTEVLSGSVIGEDGHRYVNFSKLAEFYNFAMVGNIDNMKYVIKGRESETVAFKPNSDKAFVNDVAVRTDGPSFYNDGDLYVCQSFVEEYILGFDVQTDPDLREITVSRILLNTVDSQGVIADGKEPEYEDLSFLLKAPVVTASIPENDSAVAVPTFEFTAKLSQYEEYMNPGSTTEFLTLVNENHKLSSDYIPTGLSLLKYGDGMYLKQYAAKAFEAMMLEASACGITGLTVTKAYVSYEESLDSYNRVVEEYTNLLGNEQSKRYAAATVAVPGTDEHQTGLSLDFAITTGGEFVRSTAYAWLCDNSYKFGFVLRYPLDKTDATNRVYAPEQFRYVGRYHAVRMNALNLTLDEYAEYLGI